MQEGISAASHMFEDRRLKSGGQSGQDLLDKFKVRVCVPVYARTSVTTSVVCVCARWISLGVIVPTLLTLQMLMPLWCRMEMWRR